MPIDYVGLTDDDLAKARASTRELLDKVRRAIDTFPTTPLPAGELARDKLLESHNKVWHAAEEALLAIDQLAYARGLID